MRLLTPLLLAFLACGTLAQTPDAPFRDASRVTQDYLGPGREDDAAGEHLLGWFGPSNPDHPEGADAWRGAVLAVEEANANGGVGGKPLRLATRWADDPWRGGAANVSRLVYEDRVLAVIGSIDGAATHLAEQIVVKARLPLLSPLATDPSLNLAGVSWMLSCLPGDDSIAPLLVDAASERADVSPIVLLTATDHDSRIAGSQLRKVLSSRGIRLAKAIEVSDEPSAEATRDALEGSPAVVLVAASSRTGGRLVRQLRAAGHRGLVLGTTPLGRNAFVREAGEAAEGLVAPMLHEPGPHWDSFAAKWRARFGTAPDETSAQSYDAVAITASALERSGANRALLLDALRSIGPWTGAMGTLEWDNLGRSRRTVRLGRWSSGSLVPLR